MNRPPANDNNYPYIYIYIYMCVCVCKYINKYIYIYVPRTQMNLVLIEKAVANAWRLLLAIAGSDQLTRD